MSLKTQIKRLERQNHERWLNCPMCYGVGPVQFINPPMFGPDGAFLTVDPPDPPPLPPCEVCGRPPFVVRLIWPRFGGDPARMDVPPGMPEAWV